MESLEIAQLAADTAVDKIGTDVLILDVAQVTVMCEYFVITSAPTRIQTRDIARSIEERMEEKGLNRKRLQGFKEGSWILMDYGMVVVHIFLQQEREFYDLEGLWKDATIIYDSNASAIS